LIALISKRRHHREILDQARQGARWWSTSRPEPASGRPNENSLPIGTAAHGNTRCEWRRHSINERRCKKRFDTRTEFVRFEFDDLIARDLLAIERILGEHVVEFFSTHGFGKNDAARSRYLRAGSQKTASCIVVVKKTPMRFEVSLNGGKRLYVVQKDNEHERPNEISKTRN
jgi:hypothetical protein